eukprot:4921943-Karenia_brevis.AAC.1
MKTLRIDEAVEEIYFKGDSFNGVLFSKFSSPDMAKRALIEMSKCKRNYNGHEVRFKKDAPIEERSLLSFLLGLRWQLGEWGYKKSAIKVDETAHTM